jgi:hypothetical protein
MLIPEEELPNTRASFLQTITGVFRPSQSAKEAKEIDQLTEEDPESGYLSNIAFMKSEKRDLEN